MSEKCLDLWRGDFGNAYHSRNRFLPEHVRPVFERILGPHEPFDRILEVGAGLGHNLMAIQAAERYGLEPNQAARDEAGEMYHDLLLYDGEAAHLPFHDGYFDLVLTCGLLIHIPPSDIQTVVEEIARVSKKYVLAIEYAAPEEEMVEYRGVSDALWKRNYGTLFIAWAGMKQIGHEAEAGELYPGSEWWLLSK